MNQRRVYHILAACIRQEELAETPRKMNYWNKHYRRIRALFVEAGWID